MMKSLLSLLLALSTSIAFSQYVVSTEAGSGLTGHTDGSASTAKFNRPVGIAIDDNQNLIIADFLNHCIRKVDTSGTVTTIAGNPGISGFADGNGSTARFNNPGGVDVDQNGNIFITDNKNHRIRRIDPQGNVTTLAGNGSVGYVDTIGSLAEMDTPRDLVVDRNSGTIYFVGRNNVIRKLSSTGVVSTSAGDGTAGFVNGPIAQARFNFPSGIALDRFGNIYVTDHNNHSIRLINTSGIVSTIAGTGSSGFNDGPALNAQFDRPVNIDVDYNGTLYVCDFDNNRIRVIINGFVTTLAGDGTRSFRDGQAQNSQIGESFGVAVLNRGTIYFTDASAERIRKIHNPTITSLQKVQNVKAEIKLYYMGENQLSYKSEEAFGFQLYTITGKLISEGRKNAGKGIIKLVDLASGFYVIRAISEKGASSSLKFSKP